MIVNSHLLLDGIAVSVIVSNFGTDFKLILSSTACLVELISIQRVDIFFLNFTELGYSLSSSKEGHTPICRDPL